MVEIIIVIVLILLNISIQSIDVKTPYSQFEQKWVGETLNELIYVYVGFTVFRAFTLEVPSFTSEFLVKCIGLIFFQLAINISFIIIQFKGISLNKEIFEGQGYQTPDGMPESMVIHSMRIALLILGSMVSFSVFVIISSIVLFIITLAVL
mmetsp:Transcript_5579/g.9587  ORF Transcript_5579/g.9587 Transcript_5579/m.9587 type:complete len:151 (+) Transcript_5579:407-859(+)